MSSEGSAAHGSELVTRLPFEDIVTERLWLREQLRERQEHGDKSGERFLCAFVGPGETKSWFSFSEFH